MRLIPILLLITFISKAQDTTVIITPYACDSTVTTTLPDRIYIAGYDTTIIEGTDLTAYYQSEHYMNIIGDVTVITPDYDTIPAHDTTFVCNLCATCYDTSYVITKPSIMVRPANQTKTYGQLFNFANNGSSVLITAGGLVAGDVITADNSASTGAAASSLVGSYTITLNSITIMRGATDVTSSYNIGYQSGTLTITPLSITIKADNQGKTQGQTFVFTQNGSQVDITSGTLASGDAIVFDNSASTGAAAGAAAGTYPITLSAVNIAKGATNVTTSYTITYQPGTLTVAAVPLLITVTAKNQSKTYGNTFTFLNNGSQVQVTSGSLVAGDVISGDNATSTGAGSSANAGSYGISLSAVTIMRGAANVTSSYTITYQTGTLTVNQIPISVRANNQNKTEGNTFTFTHDGTQVSVVSGSLLSGHAITVDNAASSGSGSGAADGSYTITLSSVTIMNGVTNVTSNYNITYQSGTLTVLPVEPPQVAINGMLDNHVAGATIAQEISYVIAHSCNAMRTSYDPTRGGWPTTQVHNAGLFSFMTYNTAPVQQPPDAFPTAAQLPAALNTLGQILRDNQDDLPEIISFQNEEANLSYWDGPVTDYINWLNPAVDSAHKYGALATNGGILHNFVYYIRWVYQQEGKTDSVNLINQRAKINSNTGTAAQAVIDWYKIEIPALAASRIDYINLHWYEPVFGVKTLNPNSDTTTGLLPIAINFLASRTGKPVLTNEFGTDNASQVLFNRTADEWDQNGVKIRVYYAGDGNVAENHPDYWKEWIDAHSP